MGDLVFGGGFSMMEDGGDENGYRSILEQALVYVLCFSIMRLSSVLMMIGQGTNTDTLHGLDQQYPSTSCSVRTYQR
jgi:hypothetical protein